MNSLCRTIPAIAVAATLTACDPPDSTRNDALERERKELAIEGKAVSDAMEKANREHDFSHVKEIKERQSEFYRRSAEHMQKREKARQ